MKKVLLLSAFIATSSFFVACGEDSEAVTDPIGSSASGISDNDLVDVDFYDSEDDMPSCTANRKGNIAQVEEDLFLCVPKRWYLLEGTAKTVCELPSCNEDLTGAYYAVSSGNTFFQCVDGEWLDAAGEPLDGELALNCFKESLEENTVESEDDLPNCTKKRRDVVYLVDDVVNICDGEFWVAMVDVANTAKDFLRCSSKYEGGYAYAMDEKSIYTCIDGEWNGGKKDVGKDGDDGDDVEGGDDGDEVESSSGSVVKSSSSQVKSCSSATGVSSSSAPNSSSSSPKSSASAVKPTIDEGAMTMTDNRTEITYNLKRIDGILWMTTNLVYGTESGNGVYCTENGLGENVCEKYGSFYDYETAKGACPSGWRLPTREEAAAALKVSTDPSWKWVLAGRFIIESGIATYGKEGEEGRLWMTEVGGYNTLQLGAGWNDWLDADSRGQNVRCVTESTAASSSSSAVVPVKGVCAASVTAIEKGGTAKWSFTRMSGAQVETYNWEFSDGTTSTDKDPTMTYAKAGNYTAKVTVNKGTDSESTTECSGSLEVMGVAISGCTCEFSDEGGDLRDLADGSPVTVAWAVSGCENADGSTEFAYEWSDGVKATADGASAEFTERTKNFAPSVTVTNADGTSMVATCPAVNIDDSDNPEYELTEQITEISLPAGTTVITMNLPEDWHNETSGDAHFQCVPKVTATTLTVDGESVGPGWYLSLLIPITSTINGYKLEVTLDNPADCQVRW